MSRQVLAWGGVLFMVAAFGSASAHAAQPAPISFESALEISLEKSEDIRAKESEVRTSEALRTQSEMHFLPDLNLTGSYEESGETPKERQSTRLYGAQSNLNLFRFGADLNQYKSSDLGVQSLRWDLQNTKLGLEETVAVKILDLIARHQETEIRRKLFESQQSYSAIGVKRYQKGILPHQEMDKLTIDTRIAEARLRDAELAEYQARENLRVYVGDVDVRTQWPWVDDFKQGDYRHFQFQVENHPEWQYLQKKAAADQYYWKSKESEMWPSLDLSLSYQNQKGPLTANVWTPQWTGMVTLTVPLFNRYDSAAATKLAFETKFRSDLTLQKRARELEAAWKIAAKDFLVQLDSAKAREQTLKMSRGLYQDNLRRFQSGRSSANDLFNDQDRLYQTELLAVQGWYDVHVSYIRLCHAVGMLTGTCHL